MPRIKGSNMRRGWLIVISGGWLIRKGTAREKGGSPPRPILIADQNYRCNVCIEEITRGDYMVKCDCEQVFHVECSKSVGICPKCGGSIRSIAVNALYACPKCAKPIQKDEWVWLCSCGVKYHLACAKRVESCLRCSREMDWADGKRIKVIPHIRTVLQMKGAECLHCGKEITTQADNYECICGAVYHLHCIEDLNTCPECNGPVVLEGEGIFQQGANIPKSEE